MFTTDSVRRRVPAAGFVSLTGILLAAAIVSCLGLYADQPSAALSAPAPKTPPAPDHRTGTLDLDGPILSVPNGDQQEVVWLVFRHEFSEDAALSGFGTGDRVTVRGKAGTGGVYRYLVVAEVAKAD